MDKNLYSTWQKRSFFSTLEELTCSSKGWLHVSPWARPVTLDCSGVSYLNCRSLWDPLLLLLLLSSNGTSWIHGDIPSVRHHKVWVLYISNQTGRNLASSINHISRHPGVQNSHTWCGPHHGSTVFKRTGDGLSGSLPGSETVFTLQQMSPNPNTPTLNMPTSWSWSYCWSSNTQTTSTLNKKNIDMLIEVIVIWKDEGLISWDRLCIYTWPRWSTSAGKIRNVKGKDKVLRDKKFKSAHCAESKGQDKHWKDFATWACSWAWLVIDLKCSSNEAR